MLKILLPVLFGVVCQFPPIVHAATDLNAELKDAQAALADGDYQQAYRQYRQAAEEGDNPLAQFTVAMFHQLGWGRPVDRDTACDWHERAAAGQIPAAAHYLAECFLHGIGRPADPLEAAHWYGRAAELGHHRSLCALAELYRKGQGVAKDSHRALALCRQAAELGSIPAQMQVGRYLLEGDATVRDPEAAHAWFRSATAVSPAAQYYLGIIYRDGLGRPPSPEKARGWFERAASQGYVPAYFQTARLYFHAAPQGQALAAPDLAKAYMWLSATLQRSEDSTEIEQTQGLLDQVLGIMPKTWIPVLNERVAAHLATYAPTSPASAVDSVSSHDR